MIEARLTRQLKRQTKNPPFQGGFFIPPFYSKNRIV
jgi:hypothetical protein